jgi:hypothetical protein
MIESPLIQEIVEEFEQAERRQVIREVLEARFGAAPAAVADGLEQVKGEEKLVRLTRHAAVCPSLPAFENCLNQELANSQGSRKRPITTPTTSAAPPTNHQARRGNGSASIPWGNRARFFVPGESGINSQSKT